MGRPTVVAGNSTFGAEPPVAADEPDVLDGKLERDAPPGSMLAQLRTRAELQRQARTLELPVGGTFGDNLVIRYRVLERREWDKYAVLLTPNAAAGGDADLPPMSVLNVRMMAAACETVLWVDGGERHDLEVRLDGRLAELLGHPLPAGTSYGDLGALEVVEGLFPSPMAVTSHAGDLVRWMANPAGGDEPGET